MHYDVLQALGRVESEDHVNANAPRFRLATSPSGFHCPKIQFADFHTQDGLPLLNEQSRANFYVRAPFAHFFRTGGGGARHGRPFITLLRLQNPVVLLVHKVFHQAVGVGIRHRYLDASIGLHTQVHPLVAFLLDNPNLQVIHKHESLGRHIGIPRHFSPSMCRQNGFLGVIITIQKKKINSLKNRLNDQKQPN